MNTMNGVFLFMAKVKGLVVFVIFVELMFLETSALTGENVEETFLKCAKSILSKIESGKALWRNVCDFSFGFMCRFDWSILREQFR